MSLWDQKRYTLKQKQYLMCRLLPCLIQRAVDMGYDPRLGDAYRDPSVKYGHKLSLHRSRLAIDLLLDRNGDWLVDSEDYRELGEFWERLHRLCRWGGRFKKPDGNHFSLTHGGMQ